MWCATAGRRSSKPCVTSTVPSLSHRPWSSAMYDHHKPSSQPDKIRLVWLGSILPLVCFQTRKTAGWLAGELSREGHQVALLSGEMQVEQRAAVIDRFRNGREKVLVTTNVCARGDLFIMFSFKHKPLGRLIYEVASFYGICHAVCCTSSHPHSSIEPHLS